MCSLLHRHSGQEHGIQQPQGGLHILGQAVVRRTKHPDRECWDHRFAWTDGFLSLDMQLQVCQGAWTTLRLARVGYLVPAGPPRANEPSLS